MTIFRTTLAIALLFGCCFAQSTPDVTQEEALARLTNRVAPIYPPLARQARIQGDVIIHLTISEEGQPTNVHVISGHPLLSPAAVDAVKKWRFHPYEFDEKAVEVDTRVTIKFRLGDTAERYAEDPLAEWVKAYERRTGEHVFTVHDEVDPAQIIQGRRAKLPKGVPASGAKTFVGVWCIVDATGNVADVGVPSGESDRNPLLYAAALEAVRRWRFAPARNRGLPVAQVLTLIVEFR